MAMSVRCRLSVLLMALLVGKGVGAAGCESSVQCLELKNALLRVSGFGFQPYIDLGRRQNGIPGGVDTYILDILSEQFSFSYSFSDTREWGRLQANGSWSGTIGSVKSGHSDIGIGHITLTGQRANAVDFTFPPYFSTTSLYASKPKPLPPHFNLTRPFTLTVWVAILGTLVTVTMAIFVVGELSKNRIGDQVWLLVFGSLVVQSQKIFQNVQVALPVSILLPWVLFAALANHFYCCNLKAYLVMVDHEAFPESAKEVMQLGKQVFIPRGSVLDFLLQNSPVQSHRQMHHMIRDRDNYFTPINGEIPAWIDQLILDGQASSTVDSWVFVSREAGLRRQYGVNPFKQIKTYLFSYTRGFIVSKGSPLLACLNSKIAVLVESGLVNKAFVDNIEFAFGNGDDEEKNNETVLTIEHLLFAGILYSTGILLSTLCFLLEKYQPTSTT